MACTAKTCLPNGQNWRKSCGAVKTRPATFCDKVFVGYEALLHAVFLPEIKLSSSIFIKKEEIYIFEATLLFEQPTKATKVAYNRFLALP